jgi:hypothetical protein
MNYIKTMKASKQFRKRSGKNLSSKYSGVQLKKYGGKRRNISMPETLIKLNE